ncbi:hypothetical protein VCHC57A1_2442, partial [Vibrio cholerae HC-57A1]
MSWLGHSKPITFTS